MPPFEKIIFVPFIHAFGGVGRMTEYKNPCCVIDVLAHVSKSDSTVCAVFAGSGPLEEAVRKKAEQNSLESHVRVIGWQEDIPDVMQICDMLILRGLEEQMEGLGLGVAEAQAAGLPILMTLNVPDEATVMPELVGVSPLAAGFDAWADKILMS
jgi:glycosyltransferase involved in cell wall biosynthesis